MRQIINGKLYDTDTADECGYWYYGRPGDFFYEDETLYRKATGEFFIAGKGGPKTKYSIQIETNCWSGGKRIIPLTVDEAKVWVEEHAEVDTYIELFGKPEE